MTPPPTRNADDTRVQRVIETLRQGVEDDQQVSGLVEAAASPMLILDADAKVLAVNPRAEAFLDQDKTGLLGRSFLELVDAQDRARVQDALQAAIESGQAPRDAQARFATTHRDAPAALTFLPFRTRQHARVAILARDAENEAALGGQVRRLEARIERDQKLTDLGALVSGVAHELRTPLTYMDNVAALTQRDLSKLANAHPELAADLDAIRERTTQIREGTHRMQHILRELQPLARNRPTRRAPVDLAELVLDAVRSFNASVPTRTRIILDLQATHRVALDIEEMSRVLLNLLRNASEAMGHQGTITVTTRNRDQPPCIRVEDTGPGLPPEVEARLFEPFFTTKKDGTGLGLAISRRIVEGNGGKLRHERPAEGGAAFVIEFPEHVNR